MEEQRFLPEGWDFTESEPDQVLSKKIEELKKEKEGGLLFPFLSISHRLPHLLEEGYTKDVKNRGFSKVLRKKTGTHNCIISIFIFYGI